MTTVRDIAARVASHTNSAEQVLRDTLERIEAYDRIQPQAWISRFEPEDCLDAARRVDARIANGESLPLAGVPFAVKDNIDVAGLPTTAACPAFAYSPAQNAHVVQRLLDAGAICVGKTNLDQFATGLNGTRSPYGAPRCVYNRDYVSGGSSSGSAVVVAAGLVPIALGTDTAGSGRVPAAFNGLIGLKPTKGRWSASGLVPACRSQDCVSLFARDAADAALVDEVIAGFDAADAFARPSLERSIAGPRVGIPAAGERPWFGDYEAEHLFDQAIARLAAIGLEPVEIDFAPLLDAAKLLYEGPWVAERTAALADPLASYPEAIDPTVRAIVEGGEHLKATEVFKAQYRLAAYARTAEEMWQQVDMLATPTSPTIYRVREMLAQPVRLNSHFGTYTNFVNLLDMAGVAIPAGFRSNATGFGITLLGPAWTDRALLAIAGKWGGQDDKPQLDLEGRMETVKLAVVGAHLKGMPLHWQLETRGAKLVAATETEPNYRLYALAGSSPKKPALVHDAAGQAIKVEVYELGVAEFGSFVAEVPPPLAIGTVVLADGTPVKGFVSEPRATQGAEEVTRFGGWAAYLASLDAA